LIEVEIGSLAARVVDDGSLGGRAEAALRYDPRSRSVYRFGGLFEWYWMWWPTNRLSRFTFAGSTSPEGTWEDLTCGYYGCYSPPEMRGAVLPSRRDGSVTVLPSLQEGGPPGGGIGGGGQLLWRLRGGEWSSYDDLLDSWE
jgi:hypothetical protein